MSVSQRLDGVSEYYFSTKLREIAQMNESGKRVLNFGIGSPDLPPHPEVIRVLHESSAHSSSHSYQSYRGSAFLRQAISEWYKKWYGVGLNPEKEILPLIGSKEGIVHICMTYLNPGDRVLVPSIGYPAYSVAVRLAGAQPVYYELDEQSCWLPDFDKLCKLELGKVRMMWINYPHMPTGTIAPRDIFENAVSFTRERGILLVHDNPYSFILNDAPTSILSIPDSFSHVIELNSLSKSHNMAGWRVGMLIGSEEHVNNVLRFKSNLDSGMFLPVQLAAAAALQLGDEWYHNLNAEYIRRRESAKKLLRAAGCEPPANGAGLFLWVKIPPQFRNGFAFSDFLLEQFSIFLTPGGVFGEAGNSFVRLSLCSKEEAFDEAAIRLRATE